MEYKIQMRTDKRKLLHSERGLGIQESWCEGGLSLYSLEGFQKFFFHFGYTGETGLMKAGIALAVYYIIGGHPFDVERLAQVGRR